MNPSQRIYAALDTTDINQAVDLATTLKGNVGGMKVGKEFFTANGPQGVEAISSVVGMPIFLDLKFHDIPNTVAGAIRASLPLKPAIVNVHAQGGVAMMKAAIEAAATAGSNRPMVLAVTILTSLDDEDLQSVGISDGVANQVVRLAKLAQSSGIDGVVCSAYEIDAIRNACGPNFKLLVPGIRPTWAVTGDQKRIMTPRQAIDRGADYLVIGRPITSANDPLEAAQKIAEELEGL
ncbi:MAG: orotidine-5'-phosphate decarboxylase [Rhodospirillales bacterium]|jgi:orotidine-5'-phosphate decarboxylase|nr:orotidine-5'-phosphate decarboxylase [Rhodospirillales bacterium]